MTVILGKKEIKMGWETGGSILVSFAITIWALSAFTTKFFDKQDAIYRAVIKLSQKDSIQDRRLDTLTNNQYMVKIKVADMYNNVQMLTKQPVLPKGK